MGRTYVEVVKDDLTGEIIEDGSAVTIEFGINGRNYTIDLSAQNAAEFHQSLEKYLAVASRATGSAKALKGTTVRAGREQMAAVRAWAQANGYDISARGRISAEVLNAYHSR